MPKLNDNDLRYPSDISTLYDNGEQNYIQFISNTYAETKFQDGPSYVYKVEPKHTGSIVLELPAEINMPEAHDWASGELFSTSGGLTKSMMTNVLDKAIANISKTTIQKGTGAFGGLIDPDIVKNQYVYSKGKTVVNPNTTMLYNGTGVRELQLTFTLQPKSSDEADTINKIMNAFRQNSRGQADNWGITYPNTWRIITSSKSLNEVLDLENVGLNENRNEGGSGGAIPFVLTSFNPTVSTPFLYHNEFPPAIDLMLVFSEIRPKYRYTDYSE